MSSKNNRVELSLREHKLAQKHMISFSLQVPLPEEPANSGPKESIFKNSRLMLHEIVDAEDEDWVNVDHFNNIPEDIHKNGTGDAEDKSNEHGILEANQLLQVVKITKCKMK